MKSKGIKYKVKDIYVVLSQTGTVFSRVLKLFTRAEYNHVSISLDEGLDKMYSFGRINPNNPFVGGFVEEGKDIGTFKKFYKTSAMVIKLTIPECKYSAINYFIQYFHSHKLEFSYNYLGILLACFKKNYAPSKRYYCSQFVRKVLSVFDISNANFLPKIIKPIDFLKLKDKQIIYKGLLKNYNFVKK